MALDEASHAKFSSSSLLALDFIAPSPSSSPVPANMRVPNSVYGGVLSIGVASLAFLSLNTFSPAAASPAADEPIVGDLVVAVTHKPVSCFIKSKKGDTLKMHYDGTRFVLAFLSPTRY
jgi:hypothetical protein